MAITSIGYDGSVNESDWAKMVPSVGSAQYGVLGAGDWKVTAHATMDRGVNIATGGGWGHGVLDDSNATVSLQAATVSSGDRWDMVVMRRNWSGTGGTSTFVLVQGTSAKQLPARNTTPGTIDDQPLALLRFTAGQTAVQEIIDLRCWARNGGMCARDDMALLYLKTPGSQIMINGMQWNCELDPNGNSIWTTFRGGYVPLFGGYGRTYGSTNANDLIDQGKPFFLFQAGSSVGYTDGSGYGRITWQKPFPNGVITVLLTNGDSFATGGPVHFAVEGNSSFWGPSGNGGPVDVVYVAHDLNVANSRRPNMLHRINWIAIGW